MAARLAGTPLKSERWFVDATGKVAKSPLAAQRQLREAIIFERTGKAPWPGFHLSRRKASPAARAVYERIEGSRGGVGHLARVAQHAATDRSHPWLRRWLRHGTTIDKRARELAVLVVGQVTNCVRIRPSLERGAQAGIPRAHLSKPWPTSRLHRISASATAPSCRLPKATLDGTVKDSTWGGAAHQSFRDTTGDGNPAHHRLVQCVGADLLPLEIENEPGFKRR